MLISFDHLPNQNSSTKKPSSHSPRKLKLTNSQSSLPHTKQSHANFLTTGSLPRSITAAASLILSYATFGDSKTSRILFDSSIQYCRTSFLWNTLVRACTISGSSDGFEVYNLMIRSGFKPDDHTFPFVLKSCFDHFEVLNGREVLGLVFKCGFDKDLFVGNTVLLFCGRCGDLSDAQKVFDEMSERDIVSWNTVIGIFSAKCCYVEALGLFRKMVVSSTVEPNLVSVVSVLPVCAGLEDEVSTSMVHCYVMKIGFDCQVTTRNALVDAYGKCKF